MKEVWGKTLEVVKCFSLLPDHEYSTASYVLYMYNRTEHNQGFFICFMIKNPFTTNSAKFSNQTFFKGVKVVSAVLCSLIKH